MSNKEFELEQEIMLIGVKEALGFAKKYGINYEPLFGDKRSKTMWMVFMKNAA